jgi:hypothetical protein
VKRRYWTLDSKYFLSFTGARGNQKPVSREQLRLPDTSQSIACRPARSSVSKSSPNKRIPPIKWLEGCLAHVRKAAKAPARRRPQCMHRRAPSSQPRGWEYPHPHWHCIRHTGAYRVRTNNVLEGDSSL